MSLSSLLLTCTITLLASLAAGYLPLSLQISARSMRSITTTGVGLLVGTAFIVIIPEGIHTIYNIDAAHTDHEGHEHNVIDVTTDGSSQRKSSHSSHQHTGGDDDDEDEDEHEHDAHDSNSKTGKEAETSKSNAKKLADNIQTNLLSMQALSALLSPASADDVAIGDTSSQRQLLDDHKVADAVNAATDKTVRALSTDSHAEFVSIDASAGSWIGPSLALGFVFMLLVDRLSGGQSHVHAPDDDEVEHQQTANGRNGVHRGLEEGDIELQPLNQSSGAANGTVNGASSFVSPRVSVHSPSRRNTEAELNVTEANHNNTRVTPTQSTHSPPTPPGFNLSRASSVNNTANSTLTQSQQMFNKSGMIGILTHSAVDGLALGAISVSNNKQLEMVVFLAIVLHKAPAAFGLSSFLIYQGRSKRDVMQKILVFSLMAPLAALLTFVAFKGFDSVTGSSNTQQTTVSNPQMLGVCLLFSAGTFLFTIAVHILPEITGHQSHAGSSKRSANANDSDGWWYTMCLVAGIMMPCLFTASHTHAH